MSYTVPDYERVLDAFLALKASYTSLPDGTLTLLIHGRARDEHLRITVEGNHPTVRSLRDGGQADMEPDHLEALHILFAPFSPARRTLPVPWNDWFPLPIWMYRADEV